MPTRREEIGVVPDFVGMGRQPSLWLCCLRPLEATCMWILTWMFLVPNSGVLAGTQPKGVTQGSSHTAPRARQLSVSIFNCVSVSQGSRLLPLSPHKGKMCAKLLPVFHCQLGRVLGVKLIKAVCGTKPSSLQEWKQSCLSILVLSGLKWKSDCRAQSVQRQNLKGGRQARLAVWTNQGRRACAPHRRGNCPLLQTT